MHRTSATLAFAALGILLLSAGSLQAADNAEAAALGAEVANLGWIVFAAQPTDIDGGKIVPYETQDQPLDLFVARPNGEQRRNITNTEHSSEFGAKFSPDGEKLLYRRLSGDAKINHNLWGEVGELVLADADGSNPIALGEEGEFPWASFSPDGKQIACLYKKEQTIRILGSQSMAIVRELPSQGIFLQLFWSPDGKRLVGTANVTGRKWNVVCLDLATERLTVLTRALNCTPDWFQQDAQRVIYSNRNPALFPGQYDNYGLTMLMWASVDGKTRKLIYGNAGKHCYYGCMSPDDKYVLFADYDSDAIVVGDMHILRMEDTPVIPDGIKKIRLLHPGWKEGPVFDLTLSDGVPLRGFEPHWANAEIPALD